MISFLLLEDDPDEAKIILEILNPHSVKHIINFKEMSEVCLNDELFFDYAILDLNIPESFISLSPSESNGIKAFREFRKAFPGTPILILTGSHSNEHFREMINQGTSCKIWGHTDIKTVDYLRKNELELLDGIINNIVLEVNRVNDVVISTDDLSIDISQFDIRNKRIFSIITNKLNGFRAVVSPISPGYSGAKIHLLDIQNENKHTLSKVIVKSGSYEKIEEESHNYNTYVVSRLNHTKFPPKLDLSKYGARNLYSIYYKWLDNRKNKSLFDFVDNDDFSQEKLKLCFELTSEWRDTSSQELCNIEDIRRLFLSDELLEEITSKFNMKWPATFEKRRVCFTMAICHGDFHAGNIFINADENACSIIDYGDIKKAPISFDAICLELGFLYNKDSKISTWFDWISCENWAFKDKCFQKPSKLLKLVSIRDWAYSLVEEKEFLATAYCYIIRQLKFSDVQEEKLSETLAILDGIYNRFNEI
ncbi:phosphotransferase [Providencia alcalifaciens]|uniref:phosphotransferase n=1 Tax=Providencia alcalifaciens TaxID=126385 RepID=UPI00029C39FF|nr:phosphotransferase [Providencia alcalifaciens]EKT66690.1 signal-transducing histidine kinase [Providencia alcalifaciens Dmel2]